MIFKGGLYIIKDSKGKLVKELGIEDREAIKGVFTGYKYYIIRV